MEMTVETTVTLHLKNDNYLKQKASLSADTIQLLYLVRGKDMMDIYREESSKGTAIALDRSTIKEAFDALHMLVDEAVWVAVDSELETLEGR